MLFSGADDSGTMKYFFKDINGPQASSKVYSKNKVKLLLELI
jgi:hypothetical protein